MPRQQKRRAWELADALALARSTSQLSRAWAAALAPEGDAREADELHFRINADRAKAEALARLGGLRR